MCILSLAVLTLPISRSIYLNFGKNADDLPFFAIKEAIFRHMIKILSCITRWGTCCFAGSAMITPTNFRYQWVPWANVLLTADKCNVLHAFKLSARVWTLYL
ncbi:hypothetical protein B0H12DRAFT_1134503 [Mycena haematopus]|nr:hypothetical protein B0H12DRAFT_1134503 [Mycena haematopus]